MRLMAETMRRGGYLTPRLYVPRQLWYQKGVAFTGIQVKYSSCDTLLIHLLKLKDTSLSDADRVAYVCAAHRAAQCGRVGAPLTVHVRTTAPARANRTWTCSARKLTDFKVRWPANSRLSRTSRATRSVPAGCLGLARWRGL